MLRLVIVALLAASSLGSALKVKVGDSSDNILGRALDAQDHPLHGRRSPLRRNRRSLSQDLNSQAIEVRGFKDCDKSRGRTAAPANRASNGDSSSGWSSSSRRRKGHRGRKGRKHRGGSQRQAAAAAAAPAVVAGNSVAAPAPAPAAEAPTVEAAPAAPAVESTTSTTVASSTTPVYVQANAQPARTTTSSATPAPTSGGGQQFSGRGTYYYQNGNAGSCGNRNPDSAFIIAVNDQQMNSSLCGRTATITANGKTITATVADTCPGCGWGFALFPSSLAVDKH